MSLEDTNGVTERIKQSIDSVLNQAACDNVDFSAFEDKEDANDEKVPKTRPDGQNGVLDEISSVNEQISTLRRSLKKARKRLSKLKEKQFAGDESIDRSTISVDVSVDVSMKGDCEVIETAGDTRLNHTKQMSCSSNQSINHGSILKFFSPIRRPTSPVHSAAASQSQVRVVGFPDFQLSSTVTLAKCKRSLYSSLYDVQLALRRDSIDFDCSTLIKSLNRTVNETSFGECDPEVVFVKARSNSTVDDLVTLPLTNSPYAYI